MCNFTTNEVNCERQHVFITADAKQASPCDLLGLLFCKAVFPESTRRDFFLPQNPLQTHLACSPEVFGTHKTKYGCKNEQEKQSSEFG